MEAQLPVLDPSTLIRLTQKIEGNLKRPIEKSPKVPRKPRVERIKKPKSADQQSREIPPRAKVSSSDVKRPDAGRKKWPDKRSSKGSTSVKSNVNLIKLGSRPEHHDSVSQLRLEEEVLALGGEKGDFELILGAGSESEMEGGDPPVTNGLQKGFKKDLRRLVMDLGINELEKRELSSSADEAEERTPTKSRSAATALQARGTSSFEAQAEKPLGTATAKSSDRLVKLSEVVSTRVFPIG